MGETYRWDDFRIKRHNYSVGPWRVTHIVSGREATFPVEFDHPHLGKTVIRSGGFRTKREAVAALRAALEVEA